MDNLQSYISGFETGWAFGFVLIFLGFFLGIPKFCGRKIMAKTNKKVETKAEDGSEGSVEMDSKIPMLEKLVSRISKKELMQATANFGEDNVIGIGNMGKMYKARLSNGFSLVIKKFRESSEHQEDRFMSEVLILGKHRHSNLLPLIGFCIEKGESFLVYKYMPNGNLHEWLYPTRGENKSIGWPLRVKIAIGVAKGLAWMHHMSGGNIYHCNINSRCILLDQNFEPKISNFWKAKFMKRRNYTASSTGNLSSVLEVLTSYYQKQDVYSYGILLLELVSGREQREGIPSVANSTLLGQGFDGEIFQLFGVAKDCVERSLAKRPTMLEVCERLQAIRADFVVQDVKISMPMLEE